MLSGEFEKLLNKNIKIKSLYSKPYNEYNKFKKILISLRILFLKNIIYKKYINNNYDVEVAFLEGPITTILSSKNKKVKKIAWIHTDISLIFGNNIKSKLKKLFNKNTYKKYQELVFVSNHNLQQFNKIYNLNTKKQVINNYLNKENVFNLSNAFDVDLFDKSTINFVTVARLVEAKAIDRLIRVHHKLIKNGFNHKFYIIGDGPLKENLSSKINKLNLNTTFILLGQKENPYPYILNSDYFCLFSYYEGLPMVLLEAKILNKFILITDNSSKEALENYENKKIFENTEAGIYNGLKEIIGNHNTLQLSANTANDQNDEIIKKIINILGE